MGKSVSMVVKVRAKSGVEKRLQDALTSIAPLTRGEPGCVSYFVHVSKEDAQQFVIYESWASQDDLDRHIKTPHMLELIQSMPELLAGPPEPLMLEQLA